MLIEENAFLKGVKVGSSKEVVGDCSGAINSSNLLKANDTAIRNLIRNLPTNASK